MKTSVWVAIALLFGGCGSSPNTTYYALAAVSGTLRQASLELDQEVRHGGESLVLLSFQVAAIGRNGRPQRLPTMLRTALLSLNDTTTGMITAHAR